MERGITLQGMSSSGALVLGLLRPQELEHWMDENGSDLSRHTYAYDHSSSRRILTSIHEVDLTMSHKADDQNISATESDTDSKASGSESTASGIVRVRNDLEARRAENLVHAEAKLKKQEDEACQVAVELWVENMCRLRRNKVSP
ncbi:uncharacterized protein EV420DRAFT_1652411 [Desarmillaria tabescens]|uniref:Uncharacterized protein n=1 Tax=Armillaria tabescens TaxID=1929756 RepID=A0AA39J619_ARMTA|nr:uncharacterized protein EV420DRAFT_1652411 [Desarmillaria tabescens]KAK0436810.1 hypothetical protein EV420DRAFT_1652411 [Desarmillaria tabescens]